MNSMSYIKTGSLKNRDMEYEARMTRLMRPYKGTSKPKVRTNLVKQMESKALNKYSTFRILQHLYKRLEVEILYGAVFSLLAVIIFIKLG